MLLLPPSPIRLLALLLAGAAALFASSSRAAHTWFVPEADLLSLQAGAFQVCDSDQIYTLGVEFRPAYRFHQIQPWLLLKWGEHGEGYAALGALIDLHLGRGWFLTPHFGAGHYEDSGNYNLGSKIEFRSTVELSKRLPNRHRLGIGFGHLSNGPLANRNPGTEELYLTYSFPLKSLFPRLGNAEK